MRSSYNIIKNQFAVKSDKKVICTEYEVKNYIPELTEEDDEEETLVDEAGSVKPTIDPEEVLKKYEEIGAKIIHEARQKKEKIETQAQIDAENAEKNAYDKGYKQGTKNGYEDGYKNAYDETIEKARTEAGEIVKKAENILIKAQSDYSEYLESKKNEIVDLALNIASNIVKEKLSKEDSMNKLIEEAFNLSKGEESVIIKVNPHYVNELKKNCDKWKIEYSVKNEIFIIEDESIEKGNAVLEKTSGIVKIGIDIGMEQIRKSLFS